MRDERALLGFLAFHLLIATPGAACLVWLGLVRPRPRDLLGAAGPAFLLGAVVCGVVLIALVVVGLPVSGPVTVATVALVTIAFVAAARRRKLVVAPPAKPGAPPLYEVVIERAVLGVTVVYFALGALAFTDLPTLWDDANIWSLKALDLYYHDGLVDGLARNAQLTYAHIDYPILLPLLEAGYFRAIGEVDLRLWHVELWALFAAALWTLAWLLAQLGGRWPWVVVIAVLAVSPVAISNVTLGDADLTMAALIGCGTLAFGIWIDRGQPAHALIGGLLVGGAANVKNEGMAFGLAVVLALALVVVASPGCSRRRHFLLAVAVSLACVLPWQAWVLTNDAAERATRSPLELIDDPDYLIDRLDFLWRGIGQVLEQLVASAWALLIPAFLVAAGAFLATREKRDVAAFYFTAWLFSALAVAYTYWVTPIQGLDAFEHRTGPRIVLGVVFCAAAGLAHLLQLATSKSGEDAGGMEETSAGSASEQTREAVRGSA